MDWSQPRSLEFHPPDLARFPLLRLAYQAQEQGGSATCTLNAADEVAVEAFLQGRISFPAIARVVEETLETVPPRQPQNVREVLDMDAESRRTARDLVSRQSGKPAAASHR
jgi:1-deoxy-D-xylulose-5-phosphate reductoisomerase